MKPKALSPTAFAGVRLPRSTWWRCAVLAAATLASQSRALTLSTWLGDVAAGPGNWSNALLWTVAAPVLDGRVVINNGALFPSYVNLDVNASLTDLTLGPGATLAINNGRSLTLSSPPNTIDGTLTFGATTGVSELIASGNVNLSGAGTIVMSANAGNRIVGTGGVNDVLTNRVTIQGGGFIGAGSLRLKNQGTIIANTAVPLVITPNASGVDNTGTLRAANGGTLTLSTGSFSNGSGVIDAQANSTVVMSNATVTSGSVTVADSGRLQLAGATLSGVSVTNAGGGVIQVASGFNSFTGAYADAIGSQLRIADGARLALPGGANPMTVNGGIFLDAAGADAVLEIGTPGLTLTGPGKLVLSNSANNRVTASAAGAQLTFGPSFTVRGSGQLGNGLLGLTNQGTIIADQPTSLVVRPGAAGFTNSGSLLATSGATLGLANGTFNNVGAASIVAQAGSNVDVSGSTIVGGTLTSIGSGHFHALDSSTFTNLTISTGTLVEVGNGQVLTLGGTIVNQGVISLQSGASPADLLFNGAVVVNGGGSITLSDSSGNRLYAPGGGASLTLGPGQTLTGAGEVGRDTLTLINQGTMTASGANPLLLNSSGTTFTNDGVLRAAGTGGLTLADASVTNRGSVEVLAGSAARLAGAYTQSGSASGTRLSGGTFSAASFALQGGTLSGSGTIFGPVTAGTAAILPGGAGAIGALTFDQALTLGAGTTLQFDLGGTTPGTGYDRINGTSVTLNGSLAVSLVNGFRFTIAPTDTFTLIGTSAALSGAFAGVADGSRLATVDGFGSFQVNYLSNALTLSNFQAVPEPSTWALLGLGSIVAGWVHFRRRRRA